MSVLKSMCLAFSMYSKIPVPRVAWEEKNMRYVLCFFPWVGIVIGAGMYGLWTLRSRLGVYVPFSVFVLTGTVLPVLVTGGIHTDGFMDTMDALHSYQDRQRKLEILKDSHIGAFACIGFLCERFLYAAALFFVLEERQALFLGLGFILSRILSALALVTVKSAKQDGLLYTFASGADKKTVLAVLSIELFLSVLAGFFLFGYWGVVCIICGMAVFFYYEWMAYRQFGGVTGDLAGWFVIVYELVFAWLTGIMRYVWNLL